MAPLDSRAAARRVLDRLSLGPRPGELDAAVARGVAATAELMLSTATPDRGAQTTPPPAFGAHPALPAKGDKAAQKDYSETVRAQAAALTTWWLDRMVAAGGSTEKLTWFWHGHFATSEQKVSNSGLMLTQNNTLRRLGAGSFTDLVHAMVVDPALLLWLDAGQNMVGAANENLAREFMELFTLGVDTYTEDDVKAAARALTGWTVDKQAGTASFKPARHDKRGVTLLGATGPLDAHGFVDVVLGRPASPGHIIGRLWARLVSDTPPTDDQRARLVAAYGPARDLRAVLLAMVAEPAFTDSASTIVKQPVEWAVGLMRATGVRPGSLPKADLTAVQGALAGMGQVPFLPLNVGGWPAGTAWLTTSAGVARLATASVVAAHADLSVLDSGTSEDRVEAVRNLLGVDSWTDRTRTALLGVAPTPTQLLQAAASSPEYVVSA